LRRGDMALTVEGTHMRTRIRAGRVVLLLLVLTAPAAGCHTFEPSTPLTVQVRDAETHEPLPGATVRLWRFGSHAEERDVSFTTASDGNASARLAPPDEGGVMVEVIAADHLATQMPVPQDVVDALASAKPFHPYKGPPLVVTVETYHGPRPTVELVVPDGYHGILKAEIRVQPNGEWPPGQRLFSYQVTGHTVDVSGPPLFDSRILPAGPEFVAKYANGTPLPVNPPKGEDVGLRWLRRDKQTVYYVVGTAADVAAARNELGLNSGYSDGSSRGGGRGGSGGGGGSGMGGMGGRRGSMGGMGGSGMSGP
jgi:hypothetical protein